MLQKNLEDSDVKTVATKMTAPSKSASFTISAKREMYRQVESKKKIQQVLHNYLMLIPELVSHVSVPEIHMLENGNSFVFLSDAHYTLKAEREKPNMIPRNCEPHSKLLFSSARMPGSFVYFESVDTYKSEESTFLHFNITKYNPSEHTSEIKDVHLPISN